MVHVICNNTSTLANLENEHLRQKPYAILVNFVYDLADDFTSNANTGQVLEWTENMDDPQL